MHCFPSKSVSQQVSLDVGNGTCHFLENTETVTFRRAAVAYQNVTDVLMQLTYSAAIILVRLRKRSSNTPPSWSKGCERTSDFYALSFVPAYGESIPKPLIASPACARSRSKSAAPD